MGTESTQKAKEYAVILNENARRVTKRVVQSAQEMVPKVALYSSRTKEEAYQIMKELLDRGVNRIICGGGDGTFVNLLDQAKSYLEEKNRRLQEMGRQARDGLSRISMPEFGVLKLGTGNSLAPLLGIKNGLKPVKLLAQGNDFPTRRINLLETDRQCFIFCGMGWDAQILNDYFWLKKRFQAPILSRFVQSLWGYLAAIALRTIPSVTLRRGRIYAELRNLGNRLYRIRPDRSVEPLDCPPGEIFYKGPCNLTGASTTPYYGYKLKAFPFAMKEPGLMHVRLVKAGVPELVTHAWSIWKGRYQSPNFVDYLAENVHFSFSGEMPLQIGGDAEGTCREFSIKVSDCTVDLLDFNRPLLPS